MLCDSSLSPCEEPDVFDGYTKMRRLFARQERIAVMLRGPVLLRRVGAGGEPHDTRLTPAPWRPPQSLTPMFWFQLAVGALARLLSAWVWVLRPHDWAARMLAAAGLLLLATTAAAAVYSARELALPKGGCFAGYRPSHPGAVSFGMSLVGLFMICIRAPWRLHPACACCHWCSCPGGCDTPGRSCPTRTGGGRLPILLGLFSPMPQGYAFGFFLVLFGGLAFGVERCRLFDLDRWAFRLLLWPASCPWTSCWPSASASTPAPRWRSPCWSAAPSVSSAAPMALGPMVQRPALPMEQALPTAAEVAFTPMP
ncbi:membrane hypothetical protein [Thiomonas sp. X19]|uniref:hypothetical protein n=1 Tax=Thiomonas sp. X19 TaxID=1050370 RepID=UPI000B6B5EE6|nr:hypothetical protein [Thiomonas sp. X19]SCC91968.1 membrane hypothetical protein [Thiomonas sp. X19]